MKPFNRTPALGALLLALWATTAASAQDESPARETETTSDRGPRVRTYAAGAGLTGSRFRTSDGQAMGMAGASLVFDYAVGRRFGFGVHGGFTFPLHGRVRDNGTSDSVNLWRLYDKRISFDLMFLFVHRFHLTESLDFVYGAGLHVHTLRVVAEVYNPIELISGGLGGLARIERRLSDRFFYAGEVTLAFDPLDLIRHRNSAIFVAPISLAFTVGVRR